MHEQVRCVCRAVKDDGAIMVQCEECTTWQHILCMGFLNEESLPETYFCERCKPDLYPQLQGENVQGTGSKIKTAEKKANNRSNKTSQTKKNQGNPKEASKKVLSKGQLKKQTSEKSDETTTTINEETLEENQKTLEESFEEENSDFKQKTPSPSTSDSDYNSQEDQKEPPTKVSRLSHDQSFIKALHGRKTSTTLKHSKQTNPPVLRRSLSHVPIEAPVQKLEELKDATRKHVSQSFLNIFVEAIKDFVKDGSYVLGTNETPEEVGERFALMIEYSMFKDFSIEEKGKYILTPKYKERFRTLHFNLKDDKNPQLRARVLSGQITPNDLVHMTSEEMANSEIQLLAESVRAQSTKNSVLKQSEAPRIRKTHKGEEIIENQEISGFPIQQKIETSEPFSLKPHIDPTKNPEESSALSQKHNSIHKKSKTISKTHESNIEKNKIENDKKDTTSKESFNIQDVWSNIGSQRTTHISENYPAVQSQETSRIDFDSDIDRMIDDDNDNANTPPYSPSYNTFELNISQPIWSGKLSMAFITEFNAIATQVVGATISPTRPWNEILQDKIVIDGRISMDKSTEYLCQQKCSSTKELIVISFKPQSKELLSSFEKLYNYFYSRKRYGVIKPTTSAVKDAYLIPLSPTDQLPEFIQLMDEIHISNEKRTEKCILGVFVVNKISNTVPSANKIPYHAQNTNEWKKMNNTPLMHQGTSIPAPIVPLPTIPILGGFTLPNNLSLSNADMAVLQSILNANPGILSNPELTSNSKILQQLVIQHQSQHNQINASHSSNPRPMASRWDKKW
ncbi:hypothetical protein T552_02661 [Pneumocystis carinii B80]|uniref:Transcription factor BYE1 n=1 Tax=Pneumocystis carinii (strain B80) TaxID=1408658 RepID=A0A0W4ZE44_PNEC8|nr:hypothetical protein T552_02661 [Pneumocystis carinii B80]KTW26652.1 hypothetical protein T552_02661 [Pneumocystis carinii B80]